MGQYERAIQDFSRTLELQPDDPKAYIGRGLVYTALGQYERAIQDLSRALELQPDLPEAYIIRGLVYAALGQYERAIQDFEQALKWCREEAMCEMAKQNLEKARKAMGEGKGE